MADWPLSFILAKFAWTLLLGSAAWLLVFHTPPLSNPLLQADFDSVLCTILNFIFVLFTAFVIVVPCADPNARARGIEPDASE